ncbi:MAG: carboxypeptidase-like regulatory domain-containing protein [Balneolaceae bacterium]
MIIYKRFLALIIFTSLVITGCNVEGDAGDQEVEISTSLTGSVTSKSIPLSGVEVILTDGELEKKNTTNSEGVFQFDDIPEGIYEIEASKERYAVFKRGGISVSTTSTEYDIELDKYIPVDSVLFPNRIVDANLLVNRYEGEYDEGAKFSMYFSATQTISSLFLVLEEPIEDGGSITIRAKGDKITEGGIDYTALVIIGVREDLYTPNNNTETVFFEDLEKTETITFTKGGKYISISGAGTGPVDWRDREFEVYYILGK